MNRINSHTVSNLTAHIVFVTKYKYSVLKGGIQLRVKDLIKQICDSEDVRILNHYGLPVHSGLVISLK